MATRRCGRVVGVVDDIDSTLVHELADNLRHATHDYASDHPCQFVRTVNKPDAVERWLMTHPTGFVLCEYPERAPDGNFLFDAECPSCRVALISILNETPNLAVKVETRLNTWVDSRQPVVHMSMRQLLAHYAETDPMLAQMLARVEFNGVTLASEASTDASGVS